MEILEPLIQRGVSLSFYTKTRKSLSLLSGAVKVILILAIFTISFHLPYFSADIQQYPNTEEKGRQTVRELFGLKKWLELFNPSLQNKEQTIREILSVLEKYPTGLANVTKEELAEVIFEEALRYNHDPKFILALISVESSFQNWSVSERGAKGMMQIMPFVAESIAQDLGIEWGGDRTLFNPFLNIRIGIYYLSRLILDFEDLGIALTAYKHGPVYVKDLIEKKRKIPVHHYRKLLAVYRNL